MPFDVYHGGGNGKGGDGQPPSIDEALEKIQQIFNNNKSLVIWLLLLLIGAGWMLTCIFTVGVDEMGVVQRFGKYDRSTPSGLNFKLPVGIEKVTKVKTKFVYKEEFGFRTLKAGVRTQYSPGKAYLGESLMLTGDLNVAVVPWIVQFRIKDERLFLFEVRNIRATLRDLTEATMRLVAGDRSINEVISKREEIADQAKLRLQEELDVAKTGIHVVTIEMKKTNVPEPVQDSFNEVNQAVQEKEKLIYQAREQYNKAIPDAKGKAEKTIRTAEGYAMDRINRAKGDASRFLSVYKEYAKAKAVTRRRLYLEAMREMLPRMNKTYIVDEDQSNLLPLLKLGGKEVAK